MSKGTWIAVAANCVLAVVGVLHGVDWVHAVGGINAGWIVAALAALNAAAHYYTGPTPPANVTHR